LAAITIPQKTLTVVLITAAKRNGCLCIIPRVSCR
jgi:hypothetical protein